MRKLDEEDKDVRIGLSIYIQIKTAILKGNQKIFKTQKGIKSLNKTAIAHLVMRNAKDDTLIQEFERELSISRIINMFNKKEYTAEDFLD